jgi:tetratricopeptide (TPR) repeat protein
VPPQVGSDAETVLAERVAQIPSGPQRPALSIGPLSAGQAFGTRYHIIKAVGAGGMGVVYQAWDAELGVAVALKVIRPEVLVDPGSAGEIERRFKRELVLARQVTHKHVVRIHDLGELHSIKYLTMPFVEGENLADILKRDGKVPVPRAIAIAKEVASGLAAAHEVGVIHRDLKPENIMISAEGHALIMDFGISRSVGGTGTATALGAVMGTLEYMAPEQAQGQAVDQRADIYSFGLVLYDMLTGRQRLARRENAMSEMMSRMRHAPPSVRSLDSHIPETLDRIISKCLQSDPKSRYATTADLVADLEALAPDGHRLIPAHPVTASRTTVLAIAAVLAVVLGTAGWWIWHTRGRAIPIVQREPVSVLIANFENRANEPLFDGLIEQALGVGIEGTSFVTAYPRREALRIVSQQVNASASLDENNARLVARREGIKRIVGGSISTDGAKYALEVRILDPIDGKPLLNWTTTASGKEDVLNAVGRLAAKVRAGLGDASANANQTKDAETFTAASLQAASEYSTAQTLANNNDDENAIAHYRRATELDKKFGRAYSGWASSAWKLGRKVEAEENYQKAFALLDRMSEREKYRTLGAYYLNIAENYDKAIENYSTLVQKYPADGAAHNGLAIAYFNILNFGKAREEGRRLLDIYPASPLYRYNYALYAMYAGDFGTAATEAARAIKLNPAVYKAYLALAVAAASDGKIDAAEAAYDQAAGNAGPRGKSLAAIGKADLAMYEGRYKEAIAILEAGIKQDEIDRLDAAATAKRIALAESRLVEGDRAAARALLASLVKPNEAAAVVVPGSRMFVELDAQKDARAIASDLASQIQPRARAYGKLVEGQLLLASGRVPDAIDAFRQALRLADLWIVRFNLGVAYVQAKAFPEAISELEGCQKRLAEATAIFLDDVPTFRYTAPLWYWLGRAQEGMGLKAQATETYRRYLSVRSAAINDPLAADLRTRLH